jgi:hypothetical protein
LATNFHEKVADINSQFSACQSDTRKKNVVSYRSIISLSLSLSLFPLRDWNRCQAFKSHIHPGMEKNVKLPLQKLIEFNHVQQIIHLVFEIGRTIIG